MLSDLSLSAFETLLDDIEIETKEAEPATPNLKTLSSADGRQYTKAVSRRIDSRFTKVSF